MSTNDQLYKFLTATAATLMLTGSVCAQAPGEKRQGGIEALMQRVLTHDENEDGKLSKSEMPERLQSMFARADKDENGELTKDEIRRDLEGREGGGGRGEGGDREREGGGRGREEGGRGREGGGPGEGRPPFGGPGGMPMFPLMKALDANNDGEISADEINNATAALKKLDRNKDGRLDHEELRPEFRGGPGGPGGDRDREGGRPGEGRSGGGPGAFVDGMLERHDADKDGKLSGDEIPERMRQNLSQVDTNDDKTVDRSELEAMARRFSGGRGPGGPGGGRGGEDGGQRRRPPVEE